METFVDVNRIQYVAIAGSVVFLVFIVELIRKEKIKEAYALLWLLMGGGFLVLSVWRQGLDICAAQLGVAYSPAALFLFMLVFVILILIQFSVIISKQTDKIKNLTQELSLLKLRAEGGMRKGKGGPESQP